MTPAIKSDRCWVFLMFSQQPSKRYGSHYLPEKIYERYQDLWNLISRNLNKKVEKKNEKIQNIQFPPLSQQPNKLRVNTLIYLQKLDVKKCKIKIKQRRKSNITWKDQRFEGAIKQKIEGWVSRESKKETWVWWDLRSWISVTGIQIRHFQTLARSRVRELCGIGEKREGPQLLYLQYYLKKNNQLSTSMSFFLSKYINK